MHNIQIFCRQIVCGLTSCLMVLTTLVNSAVLAQSAAPEVDLAPPVIEIEVVELGNAGEVQVFTAEVSEDRELQSVLLFYRFSGDQAYINLPMKELPNTSLYSASVPTDLDDIRNIEYYIQAEDAGGNRSVKGFVFDPLVREIQLDPGAVVTDNGATTSSSGFNRNILWGILGLLVVGAIAGAGGGGGGSNNPEPIPTSQLTVTVNPASN